MLVHNIWRQAQAHVGLTAQMLLISREHDQWKLTIGVAAWVLLSRPGYTIKASQQRYIEQSDRKKVGLMSGAVHADVSEVGVTGVMGPRFPRCVGSVQTRYPRCTARISKCGYARYPRQDIQGLCRQDFRSLLVRNPRCGQVRYHRCIGKDIQGVSRPYLLGALARYPRCWQAKYDMYVGRKSKVWVGQSVGRICSCALAIYPRSLSKQDI